MICLFKAPYGKSPIDIYNKFKLMINYRRTTLDLRLLPFSTTSLDFLRRVFTTNDASSSSSPLFLLLLGASLGFNATSSPSSTAGFGFGRFSALNLSCSSSPLFRFATGEGLGSTPIPTPPSFPFGFSLGFAFLPRVVSWFSPRPDPCPFPFPTSTLLSPTSPVGLVAGLGTGLFLSGGPIGPRIGPFESDDATPDVAGEGEWDDGEIATFLWVIFLPSALSEVSIKLKVDNAIGVHLPTLPLPLFTLFHCPFLF